MGYLLKEALKTLCGVNQWSYAVFWKIGSQNAKLLIWEECYHGPITYSGLPHISAIENPELILDEWEACWVSAEARASQSGVDARDRVHMLVNKMMVEGHINVVGEGLVGRAAFTGNHQWILSDNYTREAQPPKVINELCQQFSSGMQTVVVIPVLPHGVVQFGSSLSIMENMGFVNDVKTMVHQLGCIPGVLFSENYAINEASPKIAVPICPGKSVSVDMSGRSKVTASNIFVADSRSQQSNSSQPSSLVGQTSYSLNRQIQNNLLCPDGTGSTFQNPNTDQSLSNAFLMSQQKGLGSQIISISNPSSLLNPHRLAHNNASIPRFTRRGLQIADSSRTETSTSDCADHLPTPSGDISTQIELDEGKEIVETDIFQALRIPWSQPEEHIPGFLHDIEAPFGDDLFDIVGLEYKNKQFNGGWGNFVNNGLDTNTKKLGKYSGGSIKQYQDSRSDIYSVNEGTSDSGIFSVTNSDHLLDAVVSRVHSTPKQSSEDNVSCRTTLTNISSSSAPVASLSYNASNQMQGELYGLPTSLTKVGALGSCSVRSGSYKEDAGKNSPSNSICGSQISSWVEQGRNGSVSTAFSKRPDEVGKSNRKRLKPGEKPRPRPKDRQMIQDRVKELREIVPNGAKCSIDSLLERTIKHMLFLQSVTKHADKLKQTGESKIISKEGGLLLKDNFEGGATWAYEVGSQSMVCPIIVEDLNSPRQMLVEMLCEERGLFLEIADIIRGLGLTILKGVMETRNDKIWARFTVEANRDVTRMEIFISLVRLLEQTVKNSATSASNCIDNDEMIVHQSFHQVASIPATGMPF